ESTQRNVVIGVVALLAVLYVALFAIVGYADRVLKRKDFEREMAEKAHRESEIRLRTVVNSTPIMLWVVDKEGKLTLLEGNSLAALGINAEHAIGRKLTDVYKNVPQIVNEVNRAMTGQEFGSLVTVKELYFDTRYTPIRGQNGETLGVM